MCKGALLRDLIQSWYKPGVPPGLDLANCVSYLVVTGLTCITASDNIVTTELCFKPLGSDQA